MVLGADFRIWKFCEAIFNFKGGVNIGGSDYIHTFMHTSIHTDTRTLCSPYLEGSAPDFATYSLPKSEGLVALGNRFWP